MGRTVCVPNNCSHIILVEHFQNGSGLTDRFISGYVIPESFERFFDINFKWHGFHFIKGGAIQSFCRGSVYGFPDDDYRVCKLTFGDSYLQKEIVKDHEFFIDVVVSRSPYIDENGKEHSWKVKAIPISIYDYYINTNSPGILPRSHASGYMDWLVNYTGEEDTILTKIIEKIPTRYM